MFNANAGHANAVTAHVAHLPSLATMASLGGSGIRGDDHLPVAKHAHGCARYDDNGPKLLDPAAPQG